MTKRQILQMIKDTAELETHFDLRSMRETEDEWGFNNLTTSNMYTNKRSNLEEQARQMGVPKKDIEEARSEGSSRAWEAYHEEESYLWG